MVFGGKERLAFKRKNDTENIVEVVPVEEYFEILTKVHENTGHGKRDKMIASLKDEFYIPRPYVEQFLTLCETCASAVSFPRKGIVTKPIVSTDYLSRGQADLVDFRKTPDGEYKWLLVYQDHFTKFVSLRPLKNKEAYGVAVELFKIFADKGAPIILQTDNGREFTAEVVRHIMSIFPSTKLINGRPRHPQTQGSVERANQDVENMLRSWLKDNNTTKWSIGCFVVQSRKNDSHHRTIGRTPFRALFGRKKRSDMHVDNIPAGLLGNIETEEELEELIENDGPLLVEDECENDDVILEEANCGKCMNPMNGLSVVCCSCQSIFHDTCVGVDHTCDFCINEKQIEMERKEAHAMTVAAAERMKRTTRKILPELNLGDFVTIEVPKIDRGPLDSHLIGKVVAKRNNLYQIGTKHGIIKQFQQRASLKLVENFTDWEENNTVIALRTASILNSPYGDQGPSKCNCKNGCKTKRCACLKLNNRCNSKCHSSSMCKNKSD